MIRARKDAQIEKKTTKEALSVFYISAEDAKAFCCDPGVQILAAIVSLQRGSNAGRMSKSASL